MKITAIKQTCGRRDAFTLVEIMTVVGIIGFIVAISIPGYKRYTDRAAVSTCIDNMRQIQSAKDQWAMENRQGGTATPDWTDLVGSDRYIRSTPTCPSSPLDYTIENIDTPPTCSSYNTNHVLPSS